MKDNAVVCQSEQGGWLVFEDPVRVCCARRAGDVAAVLHDVQAAADAGMYAAGFMAYEAAGGLDAALQTHAADRIPLAWFGLYNEPRRWRRLREDNGRFDVGPWQPSIARSRYHQALSRIHNYIQAGDTYQVNYTYRQRAVFKGSAWAFFLALHRNQRAQHSAYIQLPGLSICSVSPELFFALDGRRVVARPMKGTAARGLTLDDDNARARALRASEKDRAENVMITDMIRNDLGRVADAGSVVLARAYDVERYPTVLQMTSTVEALTGADFPAIMRALFPCASVTGAPKVRAMAIIKALEPDPRGVYTGAIGYWGPTKADGGRLANFNVAIRTAVVDRETACVEYGVGGGVVWDSTSEGEYEECQAKARVLTTPAPSFALLETMLWTPKDGYVLLDRHRRRLVRSALYFGFAFKVTTLERKLAKLAEGLAPHAWRVRVQVSERGRVTLQAYAEPECDPDVIVRLAVAAQPVDRASPFLYHKTTHRRLYEQARAAVPNVDDVILHNTRGDVTETTVANLVFEIGGRHVTPPVDCGLLPGTLREELVASGQVEERVVTVREAGAADAVYVVNSVRGWRQARLEPSGPVPSSAP